MPDVQPKKQDGEPPLDGEDLVPEPIVSTEQIYVRLPLGIALNDSEALAMALDRSIRIVVLAGAVGCGKTTLLTSLYELFQSGPIRKVQFAGCKTLPAFEQRCHLSRIESEKQNADTSRTPYEGPNPEYLHLMIGTGRDEGEVTDFLFTDVSGEMFEHARNSTEECKEFKFLKRASHFLLFLDCEKALMPEKKWDMVQEVKSLLQSILDSSMLAPECECTIVWSKCDYFEASNNKEAAEKFSALVETDLKSTFGDRLPRLKFHRTAARPTRHPGLKLGFGVRELLDDWIKACPQGRLMLLEPPQNVTGSRESDHFSRRHFENKGQE